MMRRHFTATKTAVINKADNNKYCQWGDRTLLTHCWWKCKML